MYEAVPIETNTSSLANQLSATAFITVCRKATKLDALCRLPCFSKHLQL